MKATGFTTIRNSHPLPQRRLAKIFQPFDLKQSGEPENSHPALLSRKTFMATPKQILGNADQETREPEPNYSGESLLELPDFIPNVATPQEIERKNEMKKTNQSGFALLIEMLVVCTIMLLLLSIPALYATKVLQANNHNNAVALLRSVNKSEGWYFRVYHNGYATPAVLANSNAGQIGTVSAANCQTPGLIGAEIAATVSVTRTFSGYDFTFTPGSTSPITGSGCAAPGSATYTLTANPITPGASGTYYFFTDQTGLIRFANSGPASATSPTW
jgi:type IV pilus assembly protein PilA